MATWAIGDIQGCLEPLQRLIDALKFDPAKDKLWFTGDLVNRGGQSLEVLRLVKGLGSRAVVVLGNHDLHLLAQASKGNRRRLNRELTKVVRADDGEELLDWLRHRPMLHYAPKRDWLMVHAGVAPQWSLKKAIKLAAELETCIQGKSHAQFFRAMYGRKPARWSNDLTGTQRLRAITNYLTRLRFCAKDGSMDFDTKGGINSAPAGVYPWFAVPKRKTRRLRIVFGHWSALGRYAKKNAYCLDTGCVWGRELTAMRLYKKHDRKPKHVAVKGHRGRKS